MLGTGYCFFLLSNRLLLCVFSDLLFDDLSYATLLCVLSFYFSCVTSSFLCCSLFHQGPFIGDLGKSQRGKKKKKPLNLNTTETQKRCGLTEQLLFNKTFWGKRRWHISIFHLLCLLYQISHEMQTASVLFQSA